MVTAWTDHSREEAVSTAAGALELHGFETLREMLDASNTRYELIDGCIVVSPPASLDHEDLAARLITTLSIAQPAGVIVVSSNYGVHYGDDGESFFVPDLQVVRADSPQSNNTVPSLLVVELLSPSTRWKDLGRKREVYASHGIATYWVVDPERRELVVLSLRDGAYVETARGSRLELDRPYPVVVDLA